MKQLAITLLLMLPTLSGCAALAIGESEFSCPRSKSGYKCASASTVYRQSQLDEADGMPVESVAARQPVDDEGYYPGLSGSEAGKQPPPARQQLSALDSRDRWPNAPWVNSPSIDAPVPVRQPPKVMRIWVHPYEDSKGDLHMPGYVYTEIEPRRWLITDYTTNRADGVSANVTPLDVRPHAEAGAASKPASVPATP